MLLEFAKEIAQSFIKNIQPFCERVEVAGSVRREKREVKDIEICAIPSDLLGRFNIIDENVCMLNCNCGWNITVGGEDEKDLEKLKKFLKQLKKEK